VKSYNVIGYVLIGLYAFACFVFAPPDIGPGAGLLIGAAYFLVCWVLGGVYLSCVIHMGIAHRALEFKPWFVKTMTILNNAFGVYINPVTWTNRHRLHHTFSDHPGDPNKLASDGLWRTLYLCLFPYKTTVNVASDAIFRSWTFRIVSHPVFAVAASVFNIWLLSVLVHDLRFALAMWITFRVFTLWINMIQNYWTHDRRYGYRRHDDDRDNAMNIGEWLPVTITFSACLQNNHHHSPGFLRLSHDESEYDFGFIAVKAMRSLGLVQASRTGVEIPKEVALAALDF
jgi:stearoyl-CoA desaturase (delta-9 desaturase)